ncbi:MAG: hypothetical protein QXJ75_02345 [Candidatus Bathyarchaeia archaeon]
MRHVLKVASYVDREGFIYCSGKRGIAPVPLNFPLTCPFCGKIFHSGGDIKFVLTYEII